VFEIFNWKIPKAILKQNTRIPPAVELVSAFLDLLLQRMPSTLAGREVAKVIRTKFIQLLFEKESEAASLNKGPLLLGTAMSPYPF